MNLVKKMMGVLALSLGIVCFAGGQNVSAADYQNKLYTYRASENGDYATTDWRTKGCSYTNLPYGYIYAIASNGYDSSVLVRKKTSSGSNVAGNLHNPKSYWTVPYMVHTCIKNNFVAGSDSQVRLRVRTNTNAGFTSGYWSPDCSKAYSNVVG